MRLVRENLRVHFYESNKSVHQRPPCPPVHPVDRVDTLPEDIVAKTLRPDRPSDFTRFLATLFDPIILEGLLGKYLLPLFPEKPVALGESEKAAEFPELGIKVADLLQKHGTEQDRADHIDIADWLIRWHRTPNPRADATFAAVAQYFSPEVHEEIRALIHDLDLEFVGVEKMEEENDSEKIEENAVH